MPKDCTVLLVGGPRFDYVPPIVTAIKTYVEGGGRVLFMLDAPVTAGKEPVARMRLWSRSWRSGASRRIRTWFSIPAASARFSG